MYIYYTYYIEYIESIEYVLYTTSKILYIKLIRIDYALKPSFYKTQTGCLIEHTCREMIKNKCLMAKSKERFINEQSQFTILKLQMLL